MCFYLDKCGCEIFILVGWEDPRTLVSVYLKLCRDRKPEDVSLRAVKLFQKRLLELQGDLPCRPFIP